MFGVQFCDSWFLLVMSSKADIVCPEHCLIYKLQFGLLEGTIYFFALQVFDVIMY